MTKTPFSKVARLRRPGLVSLIAIVAIAGIFQRTASAKDNWFLLRTKHFNVVSNANEGRTREMALHLEQFVSVFAKVFKIQTESPVPITVLVFKSDDSFKPFKPLYNGKPANVGGYFQLGEDENIIALNIDSNEQRPLATIFHEYTHFLTSAAPRSWPTWLNEGIAEFYSSFKVDGNKVTLGDPIGSHVLYLRQNKMIPIQNLIAVDQKSPVYNERNKQGIFYAESWALVHYLILGPRSQQKQLSDFVRLIESGRNQTEAFQQAFKTDFATMDKELRGYIGNDRYPIGIQNLDSVEGAKENQVRLVSEAESKYYLGNLLLHTNRVDDAIAFFKQAMELDPALPGPYEGSGFAAVRHSDFNAAAENYKLAIARGSKNHLAYYYMATALLRGGGQTDPEVIKSIREDLRTSIKLMPGFAQSYDALAYLSLVTGEDIDDGIKLANTAIRLMPQRKHFALTLAQLQMRKRDYAAARKTLEPLLGGDEDPQLKSMAQSLASSIERYTAPEAKEAEPSEDRSDNGSDKREQANAPVLRRRTDDAGRERGREQQATQESTAHAPKGRGPTVKFEGAEIMSGVLVEIQCGNGGMSLVVKREGQIVRFNVSDPAALQFLSQDPDFSAKIGCGPINLGAFIHFKRASGSKSDFVGDAVAVEFAK
jgi:tetratricopeptide (TPR) repeat protein